MSMPARYHGKCRLCGGHIAPGDLIDWAKGQKPAHAGGICPTQQQLPNQRSGANNAPSPASEKQLAFLDSLFATRDLTASPKWVDATQAMDAEELERHIAQVRAKATADRKWASELIGTLVELPKLEGATLTGKAKPAVPDGRYAVQIDGEWRLYRVWVGTKKDPPPIYVYAVRGVERGERVASWDEEVAILTEIAKDPGAAAAEFGHRTGFCSRCGVGIEKNITRVIGIGPDCMKHWFEDETRYSLNADARARLRAVGLDPEAKDDDLSQVPPKGSVAA